MGLEVAVLWFISMVAVGEEQKKTNAALNELTVVVEHLAEKQSADHLKIVGAHASHAARSNTTDENHDGSIDALNNEVNSIQDKLIYLNEKIDLLQP